MTKPDDLTDIMESQEKLRKAFSELHKITNSKGKPNGFYMPLSLIQELLNGYGTEQVSLDEWKKTQKKLEKLVIDTEY